MFGQYQFLATFIIKQTRKGAKFLGAMIYWDIILVKVISFKRLDSLRNNFS